MQNRQALSNEAKNYNIFLKVILGKKYASFSDSQIHRITKIRSLNTVRKIRKELEDLNIVEQKKIKLVNNEKLYEIKNGRKLEELHILYSKRNSEKIHGHISSNEEASYFGKFGELIQIKYHPPELKRLTHFYPIRLYRKKLCPVCQGKLREFKNTSGILNKKCFRCHFTFYDGPTILACAKPLKTKQPLRVRPWHENYSLVRQKALNKIVSKILRETY